MRNIPCVKEEVQEQPIHSIGEITSLIANPNFVVFTGLLIQYNKFQNESDKHPQIMLFLDTIKIFVYKVDRQQEKPNSFNMKNVLIK
jgi:hypothetical protein